MKRYNISISDELGDIMDDFIKRNHTNRSNLISVAVSQYISAMDSLPSIQNQLKDLSNELEKLKIK